MSRNNIISMTLAAVTAALTVGAAPAEAAKNGLSARQVRNIVRQEVAKIRQIVGPPGPAGATGPAGPTGPRGMDGLAGAMRFAYLIGGAILDTAHSRGISQENIVHLQFDEPDHPLSGKDISCIVGLPPPLGGQVSGDFILGEGNARFRESRLELTEDGACIVTNQSNPTIEPVGYHVLLLY